MSLLALFGTFETGLIYALVALGVLLSFRVLDFPDLTADGSFPLGAFACAVAMTAGIHPVLAIGIGFAAGAAAGVLTAWLHVKLGILQLLAGIIVMTALYSINLRIGDAPNVSLLGEKTVFDLADCFCDKIPDYKNTIDFAGDSLILYEIHFKTATVTLDLSDIQTITL